MKPSSLFNLRNALPFWVSLCLIPAVLVAAAYGGWALLLPPLIAWVATSVLDYFLGLNPNNVDPETPDDQLFWHRMITLLWFPIQFFLIFGLIWYVSATDHLNAYEKVGLFFGVGVVTGGIGIVYAHELMHQTNHLERWLGDLLLASVLYSHFRSEHLLVHHRYVGTPKDPVTARYNEGFHRFFPRVLVQCVRSAWLAETGKLKAKGMPVLDASNPFWRYFALQAGFLLLAIIIGGWAGLGLFMYQAFIAVWNLELVNYAEHYGLTRKHLGNGKYEPAQLHHSWNAAHTATNWLLINLQRHSDHHYKPGRRFPLLQNSADYAAPQLPYGYPVMLMIAMMPNLFRRMMNPRVQKWRAMYYPEISDWSAYKSASNPLPK